MQVNEIIAYIREQDPSITQLTFNGPQPLEQLTKLCAALEENTTVTSLCFDDFRPNQQALSIIANMIKKNITIQKLAINYADVTLDGNSALLEALSQNQTLSTLNVEGNAITEAGMLKLVDIIRKNQRLKEIYLSNCMICDFDIETVRQALENVLKGHDSLEEFSLSEAWYGNDAPIEEDNIDNLGVLIDKILEHNKRQRTQATESDVNSSATAAPHLTSASRHIIYPSPITSESSESSEPSEAPPNQSNKRPHDDDDEPSQANKKAKPDRMPPRI